MSLPVLPSGFEWAVSHDVAIFHMPKHRFRAAINEVSDGFWPWSNRQVNLFVDEYSETFDPTDTRINPEAYLKEAVRKAKMDFDRKQADQRYIAEIDEQLKSKYGTAYKN